MTVSAKHDDIGLPPRGHCDDTEVGITGTCCSQAAQDREAGRLAGIDFAGCPYAVASLALDADAKSRHLAGVVSSVDGVVANLDKGVSAVVRICSGNKRSPVPNGLRHIAPDATFAPRHARWVNVVASTV